MMKKFHHWMVLLLCGSAAFLQCTDSDENASLEKVQLTFSLAEVDAAGGRALADVEPDVLLLSLESSSGTSLFEDKPVALLRMGDSFVTEPVALGPGGYRITGFRLAVDETTILYATPLQGSPLSKAVNHPLPHPLTVSKNKSTTIAMEVIKVGTHDPEEFGYASFGINEVNPLRVAVFVPTGSGSTLTTAQAWIVEGSDTIKQLNLGATINLFSFSGNTQVSRKLIVVKPGYNTVIKEFVYDDLIASLNGSPWSISLTASIFTINPYLYPNSFHAFVMALYGQPGSLTIDWGDGTSEPFVLSMASNALIHQYPAQGDYKINVTGDLDKIERFLAFFEESGMNDINLQGLTGLREIWAGNANHSPAVIDFTYNTQLETVSMRHAPEFRAMILPEASVIRHVDISDGNAMTVADMDVLVNQVHAAAVANNTLNGHFAFSATLLPAGDPPSPAALAKLVELRESYGWTVVAKPDWP
jgi:hypothetical protein